MLSKTTNANFIKYGSIEASHTFNKNTITLVDTFKTSQKPIKDMYKYDDHIIIRCEKGIAMICVSNELHVDSIHQFVIHSTIKLNKNVWFNFISLTPSSTISIEFNRNSEVSIERLRVPFSINRIINNFQVSEIYAYYYNIKGKNYHFKGEHHLYYELTFVDNGKLSTTVDNKEFNVDRYQAIIYDANCFHDQSNLENETCTFLTVMFAMSGKIPENVLNTVLNVSRDEYNMIQSFISLTNSPATNRNQVLIAIFNNLITSLASTIQVENKDKPITPANQRYENELLSSIIKHINDHIYKAITVDDLCDVFSISRSTIQNLFKNNLHISPKKYINDTKLTKSKILIRENTYPISEIAMILGFNSIHYFSRKFKQQYHITPSEYAKQTYKE